MPNGAYRWVDGGIYGKMGDVLQVDECRFVRKFGIRGTRYTNYRVAVGLLVGGRVGNEVSYPALQME
ncbi:hypothetical protein [Hoylesella loescheii]|uniref:Uncharacterized protein n=1 Tax=Hoylesella loescheii DSM 19665 = JCM 12249 = ATCC 15930 TaxID=1122985 RepID=A0A069QJB5_HOYLO|nr:hypothetical protein [Hoylesella loescheii]KDR52747.1 hypothetical protein HMPREF1991_01140 [Hoylesella loescheii DSM 19665 = JCM 12249 = ATCC 15930]